MGTWSIKPFENDTALDWLQTLAESNDDTALKAPLEKILQKREKTDADDCQEAIAAAAVIYAACHDPIRRLPEEAKRWVTNHGYIATETVIRSAISSLKIIMNNSELRDLWKDSDSFLKWEKETEKLMDGLSGALQNTLPSRKPKPAGKPRLLYRIIESMSADINTVNRKVVFDKLKALTDVNSPLPGTYLSPLHLVVKQGLLPETLLLLDKGADINLPTGAGDNPLDLASRNGHADIVALLLDRGAKLCYEILLDAQTKQPISCDKNNIEVVVLKYVHALWSAVYGGSIAALETLVHYGADLNQKDLNGDTLIHKAAQFNQTVIIKYLFDLGFDINKTNDNNMTPLHSAVLEKRTDAVRELLCLGANPNIIAKYFDTPLDVLEDENSEIGKMLRQYGGKLRWELESSQGISQD
jgi:hypothetical protein